MNILYQSSHTFAKVMLVSIYSMLENNKQVDNIHVYVIDCGIYKQDKEYIEEIVNSFGRTITFISMDDVEKILKENNIPKWHDSYATYYKPFLSLAPEMKELDKILYIDSDTIVYDGIYDMYNIDLGDNAVGMVCSAMTNTIKRFYGTKQWYNAGVVLFNLAVWREQDLVGKLKRALSENGEYLSVIADETILNSLFKNSIKKLPLKCNYESSWYLWGWNKAIYKKLGFESGADYIEEEIKSAKENPIIAHYMDLTTGRPWDKFNDNPWKKEYRHYCRMLQPNRISPEPPMKKEKIIVRIIVRMIPFKIRSLIGFRQHDSYWKAKLQSFNVQ